MLNSCNNKKRPTNDKLKKINEQFVVAVKNNNIGLVKKLLDNGANPNFYINKNNCLIEKNKNKLFYITSTTLFCHKKESWKFFINKEKRITKDLNDTFQLPLFIAIKNGNLKIVKILYKYGVKRKTCYLNATPIILSVKFNRKKILDFLLKNIKKFDDYFFYEIKYSLNVAKSCNRYNILKYLLNFLLKKELKLNDKILESSLLDLADEINDLSLYKDIINVFNK